MNHQNKNLFGRILIADDEQIFLKATAQLLRDKGFECDCAENATEVLDKLSKKNYDLLIADIKMPGNTNLELVKHLSETMPALKIILVTAYPSQQTAITAVSLPVMVYLVKPIDFPKLLDETEHAVKLNQFNKIVATIKTNLQGWTSELENIEFSLQHSKYNSFKEIFESFLESFTTKMDEAFKNIQQAIDLLDISKQETQICQVAQCQALAELTAGIKEAVEVLRKSRKLYKSKQLAKTRTTLEKLLKNIPKIPEKSGIV
jgi:CheY-like chemotaxis protein